jgi:D-3-phosphoglycerate dehydrogenase
MIVRSNTGVNEELYKKAAKLKVVGRAGNGVDNIDMPGATSRGIIVVNTPDSNSVSACELTVALMLSATRNIVRHQDRLRKGAWNKSGLMGKELLGKTVGIIGLGRIGALVCTRLQAFGMKVIAYDPYISDHRFAKLNAEKCAELKDFLARADFITVHTPKTEETIGMIGEAELALSKKGLIIVF